MEKKSVGLGVAGLEGDLEALGAHLEAIHGPDGQLCRRYRVVTHKAWWWVVVIEW